MCSSDSKNKRICQTLNSFCFLRYVFRQGAVFILGILIHSFLLLFSFFSKDQNFYDNLFYQCPCLNKFAKSTKSTSCSRGLESSVTAFLDGELCGLPILAAIPFSFFCSGNSEEQKAQCKVLASPQRHYILVM